MEIFAKLTDVSAELNNKLNSMEIKFFNQFDNTTARINSMEAALRQLQISTPLAAEKEKILKANPAWTTMDEFQELLEMLKEEAFQEKLLTEIGSIGDMYR